LTLLRLMASPTICAVRFLPGPAHSRSQAMLLHQLDGRTASHATSATAEKGAARAIGPSGYPLGRERKDQRTRRRNAWVALGSTSQRAANVAGHPVPFSLVGRQFRMVRHPSRLRCRQDEKRVLALRPSLALVGYQGRSGPNRWTRREARAEFGAVGAQRKHGCHRRRHRWRQAQVFEAHANEGRYFCACAVGDILVSGDGR